jgi:hypothetical protein
LHATFLVVLAILKDYIGFLNRPYPVPEIMNITWQNASLLWHDHYFSIEGTPTWDAGVNVTNITEAEQRDSEQEILFDLENELDNYYEQN